MAPAQGAAEDALGDDGGGGGGEGAGGDGGRGDAEGEAGADGGGVVGAGFGLVAGEAVGVAFLGQGGGEGGGLGEVGAAGDAGGGGGKGRGAGGGGGDGDGDQCSVGTGDEGGLVGGAGDLRQARLDGLGIEGAEAELGVEIVGAVEFDIGGVEALAIGEADGDELVGLILEAGIPDDPSYHRGSKARIGDPLIADAADQGEGIVQRVAEIGAAEAVLARDAAQGIGRIVA